ncbi:MAG: biotin transporter BioY [Lachnospiraceae bacterium]|nr:biotin transporter BioY [Lachnospiraceae bacterium]
MEDNKTKYITRIGVITAIMCIIAPISIPIGEIPITFTSLILFIFIYVVGWKTTLISYIIYVLIGLVGVPVFSGYVGGVSRILGPTGGYIIGMIPLIIISGIVINNSKNKVVNILGLIIGTIVCYLFGMIWFSFIMNIRFIMAFNICIVIFIPGDVIKIIMAIIIGPRVKRRMQVID